MTQRVLLLGASGTAGKGTLLALLENGYDVVCILRPGTESPIAERVEVRYADVTNRESLAKDGFRFERFNTVISCLASRGSVANFLRWDHLFSRE